ncbi:MAG: hypothetical protein SF162_15320 [bacterium]|nr:hypothetical protein [bacterium]
MAQKTLRLNALSVSIIPTVAAIIVLMTYLTAPVRLSAQPSNARSAVETICPREAVRPRADGFDGTGIILTAFDRRAMWVYDVDRGRRYPLPETAPCLGNCRLSPDFRSITYYNSLTQAFNVMHLDGSRRRFLVERAIDIEWWGLDRFFVWTPAHQAYAFTEGSETRQVFAVREIDSVQPNGEWGVRVTVNSAGDGFQRALVNLSNPNRLIALGVDQAYFNARAWSPDGRTLALVAPALEPDSGLQGAELYTLRPEDDPIAPTPLTDLRSMVGAVRINGLSVGDLRWSPDGRRIAFWVTPLTGADPETDIESASIMIVDVASGALRTYCAYRAPEVTPNPPHLVWSPDGAYLAFAANLDDEASGNLLLALDTESGVLYTLSEGVAVVFGQPHVLAWGLK